MVTKPNYLFSLTELTLEQSNLNTLGCYSNRAIKPCFHQVVWFSSVVHWFSSVRYTLEWLFLRFHSQKLWIVSVESLHTIPFFRYLSVEVPSTPIRYFKAEVGNFYKNTF